MDAILDVVVFAIKACLIFGSIALLVVFATKTAKEKINMEGKMNVDRLSERFGNYHKEVDKTLLSKDDYNEKWKGVKSVIKKKKLFVLNFTGDVQADEVELLREEVTCILIASSSGDEVLIKLNSGGGTVDGYGLVASQINRLKDAGIKVTVAVDRIAASGGYMSAAVADEIIAAPFSYIGSVGVIGQIPNFYKLLKEKGIEVEQHTAGEYKRTITSLTEVTDEDRDKFKNDLARMHVLFKDHIRKYRKNLDIEKIATGEVWNGTDALELGLIDKIQVSDDFIGDKLDEFEVLELEYEPPKSASSWVTSVVQQSFSKPINKMIQSKILA